MRLFIKIVNAFEYLFLASVAIGGLFYDAIGFSLVALVLFICKTGYNRYYRLIHEELRNLMSENKNLISTNEWLKEQNASLRRSVDISINGFFNNIAKAESIELKQSDETSLDTIENIGETDKFSKEDINILENS